MIHSLCSWLFDPGCVGSSTPDPTKATPSMFESFLKSPVVHVCPSDAAFRWFIAAIVARFLRLVVLIPCYSSVCPVLTIMLYGWRGWRSSSAGADAILTRVVLVHVGAVVVLTTGETATTWVLAVLADTTVTGRDVAAVLAGLGKVSRHLLVVNAGGRDRWAVDARCKCVCEVEVGSNKVQSGREMQSAVRGEIEDVGMQRGGRWLNRRTIKGTKLSVRPALLV